MGFYDYTDNGIPDAVVRTDSPEFTAILDYLAYHGPHDRHWLLEYTGSTWGDANDPTSHHVTRCAVVFESDQIRAAHDAYLVQEGPEVTLVELFAKWNLPAPVPVPKFADWDTTAVDPVGPPRPGVPNIWDVSPAWNEQTWPMGSTHKKRVDGRDVIFYRTKVMQGPSAQIPAWTDKAAP